MAVFRIFTGVKLLYPRAVTGIHKPGNRIVLTFDDGPDPVSTPVIEETLRRFGIKALFFCTGKNAEKNPELISMLVNGGHAVGNHSYSHFDGFFVPVGEYVEDVIRADRFTSGSVFRPPYGRMRPAQYRMLSARYRIVLWDLIVYDFRKDLSAGKILRGLMQKVRPGSIIALHDRPESVKKKFLEIFIEWCLERGYGFVREF